MQHHIGDPGSTLGHEDGHSGLARLKQGKASHMILMGMGEDRGADRSVLDLFQQRRCVMADMLGMHAAVKNHRTLRKV